MALLLETGGRLNEAVNGGKRRVITAIQEGWGSSGYYGMEMLERDIPTIFPVGSPMYLDHPTLREEHERPERSIRDLVGVTESAFRSSGIEMQATATVFDHWVDYINEVAPHTGLSIRAYGLQENGSAAGREGPIVQEMQEGLSIDYVTVAGAGGKSEPIAESDRALGMLREARAVGSPHVSREALQSTIYSNLEMAGETMFNADPRFDSWVYVDDYDEDGLWVVYSVRMGDAERVLVKVPFSRTDKGVITLGDATETVQRTTTYEGLGPLDLSESGTRRDNPTEEVTMTDEERAKLAELQESVKALTSQVETLTESVTTEKTRAERAEEALIAREAGSIVAKMVGKVEDLPERAKTRVIEASLRGDLPVGSDGKLIESELKERAQKALKEEVEYIAETSGRGRIRDNGPGASPLTESLREVTQTTPEDEAINTALVESFEARGMSPEAAKRAAVGR